MAGRVRDEISATAQLLSPWTPNPQSLATKRRKTGKVKPHVHAVAKFTDVPMVLNALEGLPSSGEGWEQWEKPVIGKVVCMVERTHGPPQAQRSDT